MTLSPLNNVPLAQWQQVQLIASDMDGTLTQRGQFTAAFLETAEQLQAAGLPLLIVTGRSAGWVQSVAHYLPVAGAIAENGGLCFLPPSYKVQLLVDLPGVNRHRPALADCFALLQADWPQLVESSDNRFRLTDWTFDVAGLSPTDIEQLAQRCNHQGWDFTYSTVQCHIRPQGQDKGIALQRLLAQQYPNLSPEQVLTLGDSPNDASLFNPALFPLSCGVANLCHYRDQLPHLPSFITQQAESEGFIELAQRLLQARRPAAE
jgi:hydroxymethylpyrimidine pyrophosphatase-like HAD family hydrolase